MEVTDQLKDLHIQRKKRPARAYHTLQAAAPQVVDPSASFTPLTPQLGGPGFPQQQNFSPTKNYAASAPQTPATRTPASPALAQVPATHASDLYVPQIRFQDQNINYGKPFNTLQNSLPPLVTTQFTAIDQGVSSPHLQRLSLMNLPMDEHKRASTKLPVGMYVQPFAHGDGEIVPEVDLSSSSGPMRCKRCRGYVNPGFRFTVDNKMFCNLCNFTGPVPMEFHMPLNPDGSRMDTHLRPELTNGTVDFIVPEAYNLGAAMGPHNFIFVVDISAVAVERRAAKAMITAVRDAIDAVPEGNRVAIIAFDRYLHTFNLDQYQYMVLNDIKDPFVPSYDLLGDPRGENVQLALNQLEDIIQSTLTGTEACFGSALDMAIQVIEQLSPQGGKIVASLSSLPTVGVGALHTPPEGTKFSAESEYYKKISARMQKSNVGLDLLVLTGAVVDIANVMEPVVRTHGSLKVFPDFTAKDTDKIVYTVVDQVLKTTGFQGQIKVRCSGGLNVELYYNDEGKEHIDVPVLSRDQNFTVLFTYNDKLRAGSDVSFQTAVLYTDLQGRRKVRVLNSTASVTQDLNQVFAFADQDVVANIVIKDTLSQVANKDIVSVKNLFNQKLVDILAHYKALTSSLPTQLVVPESLKTLPMYLLSAQKTAMLKTNPKAASQTLRSSQWFDFNFLPLERLVYKLYPQIIALHETYSDVDLTYNEDIFNLPPQTRATSLLNGGCYLVYQGGNEAYLWLNEATSPLLLQDLLGVDNWKSLQPTMDRLPALDSQINIRARTLVEDYWPKRFGLSGLCLQLVRPGIDGIAYHFNEMLCEDKNLEGIESLDNYLISLHKQIKDKHIPKTQDNTAQKFIHF